MKFLYHPLDSDDITQMSHIAQKAKGSWSYPQEWLKLWADQLTFSDHILQNHWHVGAYIDKKLVGFVTYSQENMIGELENLWVLPEFMNQGIGKELMTQAIKSAKKNHLSKIRIESDPHAVNFYKKFGANQVGWVDSIPKPRKLPVLEIPL